MTNEQPTYVPAEYDYIQIGIPGLDYSKAFLAWNSDFAQAARILRELRDAIHAEFYPEPQQAAPQPAAQPLPRPSSNVPTPGPPRTAGGNGSPSSIVYVFDESGQQVPACGQHKTREGGPRPFKFFEAGRMGPATWKCTAKKQDGTYCTNAVPV